MQPKQPLATIKMQLINIFKKTQQFINLKN